MDTTLDRQAPEWGTLDRPRLVTWLDGILRQGGSISVGADTPMLFEESDRVVRRLLLVRGAPVAHAAAREVTIDVGGGVIRAAILGAVATSEHLRGRGLGARVVAALVSDLTSRGVSLAILWADAPAFYEKLGFALAGRETIHVCQRRSWSGSRRTRTRRATATDIPVMRALHDREPCRVRRDIAAWEALMTLPQTEFYVLTQRRAVVAYGVVGRGHDLRGCLHEWGGPEVALPPLVGGILESRTETQLYVMSPPWKLQADRAMAFHGVAANDGALAMLRVLDRDSLLRGVGAPGPRGLPDDHAAFVRAAFGSADVAPASQPLVPLYLFGLDSM